MQNSVVLLITGEAVPRSLVSVFNMWFLSAFLNAKNLHKVSSVKDPALMGIFQNLVLLALLPSGLAVAILAPMPNWPNLFVCCITSGGLWRVRVATHGPSSPPKASGKEGEDKTLGRAAWLGRHSYLQIWRPGSSSPLDHSKVHHSCPVHPTMVESTEVNPADDPQMSNVHIIFLLCIIYFASDLR